MVALSRTSKPLIRLQSHLSDLQEELYFSLGSDMIDEIQTLLALPDGDDIFQGTFQATYFNQREIEVYTVVLDAAFRKHTMRHCH